jgi:alpha-galactosidase
LAVMASLESDPEIVFQAMCMDPLTASILTLDEIREMTRELLTAQADYLPDSFKEKALAARPLMYKN